MRGHHSLKFRLVVIICLITILSTFILSQTASSLSRGQIESDQNALLEEVVNGMASRLAQDMNTRAAEIRLLTRMESIRDPNVSLEEKRQIFEEMKAAYPYYAWIGITDAEGNILSGTDGLLVGKNVGKREWFIEGSKGLHFGDAHDAFLLAKLMPKPKWDDLPLRLVDVSAPVVNDQGELLGVICGHLSLDWAFEARKGLLDNIAEQNVDLVVLNDSGKVLMGTPQLPSLEVDLSHLRFWSELGKQRAQPLVEPWPDGKRYLTVAVQESSYKAYTGMGWSLVARKRESLAFAPAKTISNTILGIGLVTALLLGFFIPLYISRQLTPLEELSNAAEQVRREDLGTPIPQVQGNDEIATFSRSLTALVTSLQEQNQELKLTNRVFEESGQGIVVTDISGQIVRVNRAFTEITGYTAGEVLGQNPSLLASGRHDKGFYQAMWETVSNNGFWRGEIWNRNKQGELYPEWLTVTAIRDDEGEVSHYIGLFTDISEKKAYEDKLLHLANYDALTNLPNRNLLQEHIQGAIEQSAASGSQLALLFIDLDKFKHINDTMGHPAGDSILQEVAGRFLSHIGRGHTLARWGGDEFVQLIPGGDAIAATRAAQQVLDTLKRPFELDGNLYHLNASIGIALYPNDSQSVEGLLRCADTAMFQAKQEGESHYQLYESEMNTSVERFLMLDNALRLALRMEGQGLSLCYQPQFSTDGSTITGAEALLRWNHPEMGFISPADFVPIAENSKQINKLGRWVINTAMRQFKQLLDEGCPPITLSINCSPQQLVDDDFAADLRDATQRNNIPSRLIRLEVTESALMSDEVRVTTILGNLRAQGYTISIDDFGTGFSCLHYIQKIHPDEIKVDKSFVDSIETDEDSRNIISFTVGLAQSMNMEVVAEGVESEEQLALLKRYGEITIQGYLYSKPLPFEEFRARLKRKG